MQVMTVTGDSANAELLNAMYELRARVFAKRLGWSVKTISGREADEFDTPDARYILIILDNTVVGCARLLEFSAPTMVGSHFADLVDASVPNFTLSEIESSRFCVDTNALRLKGEGLGAIATSLLISAMIDWAALHDYTAIVTVTDVRVERLLRRLDVPFDRLGRPRRIEQTTAIAGKISISAALARQAVPILYESRMATSTSVSV